MYVSVKSFFVLFSVQLECTWASKDAQVGFVTQCHGLNLLPNMYAVFKSRLISSARICYWTQHTIVQTQLATLPVLKREVLISQPQIRHYGFKLGRPFRQPFRHIITHHKHWIFANTQHSNNIISHNIDINNYFNYITYIYLFIYNANLLGTWLSMLGFKMGSF